MRKGGRRVTRPGSSRTRTAERPTGRREHQRVDLFDRAAFEALERAECSVSTAMSRPRRDVCAARASSPAATRLSLFASARSRHAGVPTGSRQSGEADDRVQHEIRLARSSSSVEIAAGCVRGAARRWAASPRRRHELELRMRVDDLQRLASIELWRARSAILFTRKCRFAGVTRPEQPPTRGHAASPSSQAGPRMARPRDPDLRLRHPEVRYVKRL